MGCARLRRVRNHRLYDTHLAPGGLLVNGACYAIASMGYGAKDQTSILPISTRV